ncbi:MAG: hypothetical protein ABI624_22630 [Casimicrobiaceae bacterium]
MRPDPDADLRAWFQEVREHDSVAAPAFEGMLPHPPRHASRGRQRLAWTAGGVALATAAGLFLLLRPPAANDVAAVALPAFRSPTDFLLAGAGASLQHLSWTPSPTSGLGQASFNPDRGNR